MSQTAVRVLLLLSLLCCAQRVRAGGLEYAGQGAQSLARGGAVAARAEDPMVLAHNPAGLAELRGSQLAINFNLALFDACLEPAGYYGWGTYLGGNPSRLPDPRSDEVAQLDLSDLDANDQVQPESRAYYVDALDTVCLDQQVVPIPQIAWTLRVSEKLGIGFGLIFPAAQPSGSWGGDNGVIRGDTGELRPAPTRYMMMRGSALGVFPNLGFGYRIVDALRVGMALEYGLIAANNFTMAGATGGTSPQNDIITHAKVQDWFIPAFTASVHAVPIDSLDVVLAFRWQDDIDAKGTADLTTGVFDPRFEPYTNKNLKIDSVTQNMPWKLRAGIRYAERLAPRPVGTGSDEADLASPEVIHDPLQDERWDIELDVEYQLNGRNREQVITFQPGQRVAFDPVDMPGVLSFVDFPHPAVPRNVIEKHWRDQISARLGGTYNVVPGLLGVSAGAHFETRGVDPAFMQIDYWPVSRLGLHTGVILRVARSVDVVFSYAHIFQEDLVVAPPAHRPRDLIDDERKLTGGRARNIDKTTGAVERRGPVGENGQVVLEERSQGQPDGTAQLNQLVTVTPNSQPPYIINAGRYRSNFDVLAAGVNVHF